MILVVDDDLNARELLARLLSARGHQLMLAEDAVEAMELLKFQQFSLVITDLALPGITGFALIGHIRTGWPQLPVILVTGYLSHEAAKKILDEHVEHVPKPIDRDLLISTVDRLLNANSRTG